ncbi:MAG: hypothetical protein ACXWUG_32005 [Polyangiales bacterium]
MYLPLAPCTSCRRHVRASEPACPFCGGKVGVARGSLPEARLARAGIAALALATFGCTEPTREAASPDPVVKPVADAAVAEPTPSPTPPKPLDPGEVDDPGTMHAKYGGAPMPKPTPPHVMPVPAYGLPPKPPASVK